MKTAHRASLAQSNVASLFGIAASPVPAPECLHHPKEQIFRRYLNEFGEVFD